MRVLGIESSCDETAAAIVEGERVLADVVASQIAVHAPYGGVVPELASRAHVRNIAPVVEQALAEVGGGLDAIDAIAVTRGPGLVGALLVGLSTAKAIAMVRGLPLVGVDHLVAHLFAVYLDRRTDGSGEHRVPELPFVALLVSGGHTALYEVRAHDDVELLGQTRDDAAGEAFDKSAKLLGLPYPGGPALAALAGQGDADAFRLPRPLLHSGDLDFSFSGLKTAVMTRLRKLGTNVCEQSRADLAASTQRAIVDVLVAKSLRALEDSGLQRLVVAGGVGANVRLREVLDARAAALGVRVHYPPPALCTDNGAMIALAAALRWQHGLPAADPGPPAFDVMPRWPLEAVSIS